MLAMAECVKSLERLGNVLSALRRRLGISWLKSSSAIGRSLVLVMFVGASAPGIAAVDKGDSLLKLVFPGIVSSEDTEEAALLDLSYRLSASLFVGVENVLSGPILPHGETADVLLYRMVVLPPPGNAWLFPGLLGLAVFQGSNVVFRQELIASCVNSARDVSLRLQPLRRGAPPAVRLSFEAARPCSTPQQQLHVERIWLFAPDFFTALLRRFRWSGRSPLVLEDDLDHVVWNDQSGWKYVGRGVRRQVAYRFGSPTPETYAAIERSTWVVMNEDAKWTERVPRPDEKPTHTRFIWRWGRYCQVSTAK